MRETVMRRQRHRIVVVAFALAHVVGGRVAAETWTSNLAVYRQAVAVSPRSIRARLNLVKLLAGDGHFEDANHELQELVALEAARDARRQR